MDDTKCVNGNCGYEFESNGYPLYEERGDKHLYNDDGAVLCPICGSPTIRLKETSNNDSM